MFSRLGDFVAKHWLLVIAAWCVVVVGLRIVSPKWDDVTKDGDLQFLPRGRPSVLGEQLAKSAFPENRSKSQVVIVFARDDRPLNPDELKAADRFAARFHNYLAMRWIADAESHPGPDAEEHLRQARSDALAQWDEALRLDESFAEAMHNKALVLDRLGASADADELRDRLQTLRPDLRLDESFAEAMHNKALVLDRLGASADADELRGRLQTLRPDLPRATGQMQPATERLLPLVDVWNRHNEVFGDKLRSTDKQAVLLILHLRTEFMATENMAVVSAVDAEVQSLRRDLSAAGFRGLSVGVSGSAAVGGDMLLAAADSIKNTELYTIVLVITILLLVYRAPLLVLVPLVTIGVSLSVSTNLLSLIAQLADSPAYAWFGFNIFKTTKIFIVVILFGAGTDFCLFLISRYRECLQQDPAAAISKALSGVADALVASALTTIVGLAMMAFADFGKFRSSGPAIGLCLFVTLLACLTLAPAILRLFGSAVFWPASANTPKLLDQFSLWDRLARWIVARPGPILIVSVALLLPLAWKGWYSADNITFDFLSELDASRVSVHGSELLKRHFPIGEGGPVVVFGQKKKAGFDSEDRREAITALSAIFDLTKALTEIEGVEAVRSLAEPLGEPPEWSLMQPRKNVLRQHKLTKLIFLAQGKGYRGDVTRFEIVLKHDPFSREAIQTLLRIDSYLQHRAPSELPFWADASFSYAGTTAGIRDLRDVTRSDRRRIQVLVVLAVLVVLLVILRRPAVCLYLILSVLFSYFVTIGLTEMFFSWQYGDSFQGLDWKVPIFLFVILVAVGEDYNIYLVTRITEEQRLRGRLAGLREGIVRTGGIITSCGVIMAGTFISMTAGSLRAIVELGFALSFGVLLDTFVVRTILVPAFLACGRRGEEVADSGDSETGEEPPDR